jgi:hypothetical protein
LTLSRISSADLVQRKGVAAVHHGAEPLLQHPQVADAADIDVVHQQHVDPRDAEAEEGLLQAAHHAVVGVVVGRQEAGQAVRPRVGERHLALPRHVHEAADLRREHVLVARLVAQHRAEAQLAAAVAVEGRGVEEAHAAVPGGLQQRRRLGFGDGGPEAADRGAAEAERG